MHKFSHACNALSFNMSVSLICYDNKKERNKFSKNLT